MKITTKDCGLFGEKQKSLPNPSANVVVVIFVKY